MSRESSVRSWPLAGALCGVEGECSIAANPTAPFQKAERVPHLPAPCARNGLAGVTSESGCFLGEKGNRHIPLSRRDNLRIARRFNAGKVPAWHTSPEGIAEGWTAGLDLSRPFGTRDLLASTPALN